MKKNNINNFVNLASSKLGTKVMSFSDDFFGKVSRMLNDKAPQFIEDKYDNHGKWMDGWESKRRRDGGHDWAIIKLGSPGKVYEIEIDTSFFTGNYPPFASIQGLYSEKKPDHNDDWKIILKKQKLQGDKVHNFKVNSTKVNYIRFQIFPDGGIARLRLLGHVEIDLEKFKNKKTELSSLNLGGKIIAYNNAHYGDVSALLTSGRGKTMGDGWETRRRREPGNDWIIIKLAKSGIIEEIEIDTAHFKGNFPDKASISAAFFDEKEKVSSIIKQNKNWKEILPPTKLKADKIHRFKKIIRSDEVNYVKLNIFPDGGVSRLRVFGKLK